MLELDPRLNFDPQQEVNHQFAQTVVLSATQLATSGEITASLAAISQALQLDSNLEINKITWNSICWKGALAGLAEQVMFACENAVAPGPYVGFFRDSRGLARALTGNPQGATEDFEAFIQWAKENIQGTELIPEREAWIAALKAGKNPFTPEVLQQLRNE